MAEGGIAPELRPRPAAKVEAPRGQTVVLRTFKSAVAEMSSSTSLRPQDQKTLEILSKVKAETIDKGLDSFENKFEDLDNPGHEYTQIEGIPIEGLLDFLNEQAKGLTPGHPREINLRKMIGILSGNSLSYEQIEGRGGADQWFNRVRQEAYFVAEERRRNGIPDNADTALSDWLSAKDRINNRRELILQPKRTRTSKTGIATASTGAPTTASVTPPTLPEAPDFPRPEAEISPEADEREGSLIPGEREILLELMVVNGTEKPRKRAAIETERKILENFRKMSIKHPKDFLKGIGLRLSEEWNRQRLMKRGVEFLLRSNNSLAKLDVTNEALSDANARIDQERAELRSTLEGLRKSEKTTRTDGAEAIEHGANAGATIIEARGEIKTAFVNEVLGKIVSGEIEEDKVQDALRTFVQAHSQDPTIQEIFGRDATKYKVLADYFATDIWELAEKVRTDRRIVDKVGKSIEEIVTIKFANVSWSQEGEVRFNRSDKIVAWAQGGKYRGLIFNPASIGAISSIIATPGTILAGAGAKIYIAPVVGTALGSVFAGMRRNRDLNIGRNMTGVELAAGMQIGGDAKRRKEMVEQGKVGSNMVSLRSLLDGGRELPEGMPSLASDTRGLRELAKLDLRDGANQDALMRRIAEIETRFDFGRGRVINSRTGELIKDRTDLISYSEEGQIAQERLEAIIEIGTAKAILKGLGLEDLPADEVERKIATFRGEFQRDFTKSKEEQDWEFNKYKFRQVAKSVAIGAATGGITAAGFQQGVAWIGRGLGINIGPTAFEQVGPAISNFVKGLAPNVSAAGVTTAGIQHITENTSLSGAGATETAVNLATGSKDIPLPNGRRIHFDAGGNTASIVDAKGHSLPSLRHLAIKDGKLVGSGELSVSARHQLVLAGIDLKEHPGVSTHTTEHVVGKDGLWEKLKTPIKTREHYANNTTIPDKEELQLYTSKLRNGSVVLNMRHMQPTYENGLVPPKINPADVIKNHESAFVFSLGGDSRHVITIPDGADGKWDGLLHLNPNDHTHFVELNGHKITLGEFTKMVVNQEKLKALPDGNIATEYYGRYDVWNLAGANGKKGLIEAVRLVPGSHGTHIQEFATIHGGMKPPETITTTTPGKPTWEIKLPVVKPPEVPPVIPPVERPIDTPPIAFPFTPRFPLEALIQRGGEYGIYEAGFIPTDRRERFDKARSKTLDDDPKAKLDPYKEAKEYFDKLPKDYVDEVRKLSESIGVKPSDSLKIMVIIPVAGHQEGNNIYNSLENYTTQELPQDQFEIILFVNYPEKDKSGNPIKPDKTTSEIERFKKDHPNFPVRVVTKVLSPTEANIGTIRKYGADIGLYRQMQRGPDAGEIILISNDADSKGIAPTYLSEFAKRFEDNPDADGFLGQLDWDPEAYAKYPTVHVGTRLFQYLGARGRLISNRMPSSGANFALRGSIYAGIGGYLSNIPGGEDIALGQAISLARSTNREAPQGQLNGRSYVRYAGGRTRLYTSARRAIDAAKQGLSPVEQWNSEFSPFDDEIRRYELNSDNGVNYDNPNEVEVLRKNIETVIDRTITVFDNSEGLGKDHKIYKRAVGFLGVQYEVKDGKIVITDMSKLLEGLREYQKMGTLLRDIKSGKASPEQQLELMQLLNRPETPEELSIDSPTELKPSRYEVRPKFNLEELKGSSSASDEGKYVICNDKVLGVGEMGEIVAGYNKETGEILAFKRVDRALLEEIAKQNNYPEGVIDLEDYAKEKLGDSPYLSLYRDKFERDGKIIKTYSMEATDLSTYLKEHPTLDPETALKTSIQISEALKQLHSIGIIHTDVFTFNILIDPQGNAKLADLGISSINNEGEIKRGFVTGFKYGKPPELFQANPSLNPSIDTYEVATMLYRNLTGDYPYTAGSETNEDKKTEILYELHKKGEFNIPDSVPDSIQKILRKGIQPDPAKRYQTAQEMLEDLRRAYEELLAPSTTQITSETEGLDSSAPTPPTTPTPRRPTTREIVTEAGRRGSENAERIASALSYDRISGMAQRLRPDREKLAEVRSQIADVARNAWVQYPDIPYDETQTTNQRTENSQSINIPEDRPSVRENAGANPRGIARETAETTATIPEEESQDPPALPEQTTDEVEQTISPEDITATAPLETTTAPSENLNSPASPMQRPRTNANRLAGGAKNFAIGFAQGAGVGIAAKATIAAAKRIKR